MVFFKTDAIRQTNDAIFVALFISETKMLVDGVHNVSETSILQRQEEIIKILDRHQMLHSNDRSRTFGDNAIVKIFLSPSDQTYYEKKDLQNPKDTFMYYRLENYKCWLHMALRY